jgi:hypothetical protein
MDTDRTDRGGETSGSDGHDGASTGGSVGVAEALAAEFEGLMDAAEVDQLRQKQQSMCVAHMPPAAVCPRNPGALCPRLGWSALTPRLSCTNDRLHVRGCSGYSTPL